METIGLLGMGVQDGHLIFHTAPKLCLGNWKMGWPFQGIVSLWKFVNFVVFRALGKTISLSVRNCISQDWTVGFFLNKENCYVKSQRMHFLSILTDRVCWPSVTVRVASHYRMCRRVAYLCVAFPCHIAVVCKVWKDFSVQTLSRFTIRLSQLAGCTHPCLVSASPACSVWLWQCCWSRFFIPRDVPQIQQLLWQKYHPEEQQQHRYPSTWLLQRRRLQLGPTQIWRGVWSKCARAQFSVHWKLHLLSCDCCYVCVYVCLCAWDTWCVSAYVWVGEDNCDYFSGSWISSVKNENNYNSETWFLSGLYHNIQWHCGLWIWIWNPCIVPIF